MWGRLVSDCYVVALITGYPIRLMKQVFIQTQCVNTVTLIDQTYSLQRVPEWGGMRERETHLLASWQRIPECTVSECSLTILTFNPTFAKWKKSQTHRSNNVNKNVKWFVHTRKELRTEVEKHWRWERRSGNGVGQIDEGRIHGEMQYLEGGWAYTGFCRAVHSAGVSLKFIKSSNVKRGEGEGAHTPYDMCEGNGHSKNAERKVAVLERGEPQLVSQREEPAAQIFACIYLSVSWVCVWSVSSLQIAGEGGGRGGGGVPVNAVSTASGLAAEQWQSNLIGRRRVWGHTQTQVWHAVRKQSVAHSACLCLCLSVYIRVCARVYIWEQADPFMPSLSLNLIKRLYLTSVSVKSVCV